MAITSIGRMLRDAWLVAGIVLALLIVTEGVLALTFVARDWGSGTDPAVLDDRQHADAYPNEAWVRTLYGEYHRASRMDWQSYVYWRRRPFRGTVVNVDERGMRLTTPVADPHAETTRTVFMFGGSTMWGTGVRDAFTIPSLVSRLLHERGMPAAVISNFGESGYVSTQEVVALLREIHAGRVPDLVVFYDGINDTFSA